MSDDSDIVGKADALLRRHGAIGGPEAEPEGVPVLRELVSPASPMRGAMAVPAPRADDRLTKDIVAEVVNAVQARLALDLERRLSQQLIADVQATLTATLADLRQDVANAVGDAVAEALSRRPNK